MKVSRLELPEVLLIEPKVFGDSRGFFVETWAARRYAESGIPETFVQDNLSCSQRGVVRGLHLQVPNGQGKLVQVVSGEVLDVAVDVRVGSPRFGKWVAATLSGENKHQLYIPPGFAHGFCVLSEQALFAYKCTAYYEPQQELGVNYADPDIGIAWPIADPKVSAKDAESPRLKDIAAARLPKFEG